MLGGKINKFKKSKSTLAGNYIEDFEGLIDRLEKFNKYWVISKHGMIVGGTEHQTIHKDGNFYIFDRGKQDEIGQGFTQIMGALIEISKQI
jgi:hypothetical protein